MDLTRDGIFHNELVVLQPRSGYRFAVDSVLLGAFACRVRAARCVDLGSGCGVIGFILLARGDVDEVVGVEIDHVLANGAREGASANGLGDRYRVVEGDLRDSGWRETVGMVDLAVSNPPYHRSGDGRTSPDQGRARARHDETCTLGDLLDAAASCLRPKGRLCVVLPPGRLVEFLNGAADRHMFASRIRPVYPRAGRDSRMTLVEVRKEISPHACKLEPPLTVHDEHGKYTPELDDILAGRI